MTIQSSNLNFRAKTTSSLDHQVTGGIFQKFYLLELRHVPKLCALMVHFANQNCRRHYFCCLSRDLDFVTLITVFLYFIKESSSFLSVIWCRFEQWGFEAVSWGSFKLTMLISALKVSKSQKHFFSKLHCPKNEWNIRQNSALESRIG